MKLFYSLQFLPYLEHKLTFVLPGRLSVKPTRGNSKPTQLIFTKHDRLSFY